MYERSYHQTVLKEDGGGTKKSLPWKRILCATLAVAVLVGIVLVIRIPQFQIRTVEVFGTNVAGPIEVSDFVLERLEGRYAWVLPKGSIFLVVPDRVKAQVSASFPRFKQVEVKRTSMHSLEITVEEYAGIYLWCDEACSFMDERGTVFADAPYFSGNAYIKIYNGIRAPYPFYPLSDTQLQLVRTIVSQLAMVDIAPVEFRFENEHKLSVVFFHHGNRAELYFDPANDATTTIDTLFSGLKTEPLSGLYRSSAHVLHYIDLRFSNKVVYKFD